MLKTKKKIIVYTSLLGIIICILSFIVYAKITEGMVREKPYRSDRILNLKLIRADVLNYMRKYPEQKNFNLFDVFISNASLAHQDAYFIPLKHVQFNIEYKREEFYNASSYRLLNDDTGWWGIIETECGIVGQYFLLISSDGEISQINTAFLPEQKMRWNAKKQKYKSTFDGQN